MHPVEALPLLELFTRLQEAGLPLGIGEYELVLKALQRGFGFPDRAALFRLCCTIWVKSEEERRIFAYHFEQVMNDEVVAPPTLFLQVETKGDRKKSQPVKKKRSLLPWVSGGLAIAAIVSLLFHPSVGNRILRFVRNTEPSELTGDPIEIPQGEMPNTEQDTQNNTSLRPDLLILGILALSILGGSWLLASWIVGKLGQDKETNLSPLDRLMKAQTSETLSKILTQTVEDKIQIAQTMERTFNREKTNTQKRFFFSTASYPLTQRQMKQSWRYLRCSVREGRKIELDINATANKIGRDGFLLDPVLIPRRTNRVELLLLVDREGSMVAFHSLCTRLVETALHAGRLGKLEAYYFHNCPVKYLYRDPYHQDFEAIASVFKNCSQWTVALIVSDGGAARGGYNEKRVQLTATFLRELKQQVRYLAWLNPMPRDRWLGTTAEEIAQIVPMFAFDRVGFQSAIDALRGRSR
jgi:uncharacterized protein with von Willebrand factor type A (vWA) domain